MNETALQVHGEVLEFDADLQQMSDEAQSDLEEMTAEMLKAAHDLFLQGARPAAKEKKPSTFEETHALLEEKKSLGEMSAERGVTAETIVAHIEKLVEEGICPDISYLKKEISPAHWKKIEQAFEEELAKMESAGQVDEDGRPKAPMLLSPLKSRAGANVTFLHIRLARLLLGYYRAQA